MDTHTDLPGPLPVSEQHRQEAHDPRRLESVRPKEHAALVKAAPAIPGYHDSEAVDEEEVRQDARSQDYCCDGSLGDVQERGGEFLFRTALQKGWRPRGELSRGFGGRGENYGASNRAQRCNV